MWYGFNSKLRRGFIAFIFLLLLPAFSGANLYGQQASSGSGVTPVKLTWIDAAFAHFYPVPGTRLDDFINVNYGGMARLNFMLFGIKPLWVSTSFMIQENEPNIARIQTLTDYSFMVGAGWRFAFSDWNFHKSWLNRWYFTPRYEYGIMLHVTYGDYYDDPDIYPADPRAGDVKTRVFTDQVNLFELEFAYDLTPTFRNTTWASGVQSELFLSPSIMYFPEKDRDGWQYGYLAGVRIKGSLSSPPSTIITGKVVDAGTGQVLSTALPAIQGDNYEKVGAAGGNTFAFKVDHEQSYVFTVEEEGYEVNSVLVPDSELELDGTKVIVIELKRSFEWGVYGNVYMKDTGEPIAGVKVTALERQPGEAYAPRSAADLDDAPDPVTTSGVGDFRIRLKQDTDYDILLEKKGFFTIRGDFSTRDRQPGWYPLREYMKMMLQVAEVGAKIDFDNIYYDTGRWNIRSDSERVLNQMTQFLRDNPNIVVELSAHTDSRGDNESNRELSQKRAKSAVDYIVNAGIARDRIFPKGYGEEKILNQCTDGVGCTASEHQINRRTEFRVRKILE